MVENLELNSSVLQKASFNSETSELVVQFKNGRDYSYKIPIELWNSFKEAPSKGNFFVKNIKGKFKPES